MSLDFLLTSRIVVSPGIGVLFTLAPEPRADPTPVS